MSDVQSTVEYRDVQGFPGYRVGDDGTVWSTRRGLWKPLISHPNQEGYLRVRLWNDGQRKNLKVHVLVLNAFVGPRPIGYQACHYDGTRTNNARGNLRWDTPSGNCADRARHGRKPGISRGEGNGRAKLTDNQVLEIRRRRTDGEKVSELAKHYRVHKVLVYLIVKRKIWKHI